MEQYCTLYSEIFFPSPSILPTVQKCIISQKVVHISSLQMPVLVRWRFSSFTSTVSCSKCPWNLRKISGLEHSVPQSRHWHLQKTCKKNIHIHGVSYKCRENRSSATPMAFNKRTNARNARENEEEFADVELAISNTGIEATWHPRIKIPRKEWGKSWNNKNQG